MAKREEKFPFENLTKVKEEIDTGMEAYRLLERVYCEIGPYQDAEVTKETWDKVRNFFGFDDSE